MTNHLFSKANAPFFVALIMMVAAITVTLITEDKDKKQGSLFPNFDNIMSDVVAINIDKGNMPLTLIKNGQGDWFIGEMDAYPADKAKVDRLIKQFADFKLQTVITSNVATYAKWGLEEPSAAASTLRISFVNLSGKMPISVIVGTHAGRDTWYMRRDGSRQVLLVKGKFDYSKGAAFWADTTLLKLNPNDVMKTVMIDLQSNNKEELVCTRKNVGEEFICDTNFKPTRTIKNDDALRIANGFKDITFTVARRAASFSDKGLKTLFKTEVQTKDDDIYMINFVKVGDDDLWIELISSDTSFNEHVKGWLYQLPFEQMLNLLPPQELAKE